MNVILKKNVVPNTSSYSTVICRMDYMQHGWYNINNISDTLDIFVAIDGHRWQKIKT